MTTRKNTPEPTTPAAETPKSDNTDIVEIPAPPPITGEAVLAARKAALEARPAILAKSAKPRKGDTVAIADIVPITDKTPDGVEYVDFGTVSHKPGGSYVSVRMDSSGRTRMIRADLLKKVGSAEWILAEEVKL